MPNEIELSFQCILPTAAVYNANNNSCPEATIVSSEIWGTYCMLN